MIPGPPSPRLEGPNTTLRAANGWGAMSVAYAELPSGTDLGPLLAGLANDLCPCPHWGYLLKGKLHIQYSDGTAELIRGGDVFYLPPGHTGRFEEDSDFSGLIAFPIKGVPKAVFARERANTAFGLIFNNDPLHPFALQLSTNHDLFHIGYAKCTRQLWNHARPGRVLLLM
jgi:hypothetical protein